MISLSKNKLYLKSRFLAAGCVLCFYHYNITWWRLLRGSFTNLVRSAHFKTVKK